MKTGAKTGTGSQNWMDHDMRFLKVVEMFEENRKHRINTLWPANRINHSLYYILPYSVTSLTPLNENEPAKGRWHQKKA